MAVSRAFILFNLPSRKCSSSGRRTRPSRGRARALLIAVCVSGTVSATAGGHDVVSGAVTATCRLTIGGSFEAKSAALTGNVSPDPVRRGHLLGELMLDLETLKTGIRLRDSHMRDRYLEVQAPDNRVAVLRAIVVEQLPDGGFASGSYPFRASLRMRGHEQDVAGRVEIHAEGSRLRADAVFPLRLSEFAIARPAYLGVGVSDELTVHVKLTAQANTDH